MYRFKGFASISGLASNVANTTSPIGELSAVSMTYAKDIKIYNGVTGNVQLYGFSSKLNDAISQAPDEIIARCIELCEWVVNRQTTIAVGETFEEFRIAVINAFLNKCSDFEIGELVLVSNDKQYPSFISWKSTDYTVENLSTVYFSNNSFEQNYDEYVIDIVPPLIPIDDFFGNYVDVVEVVNSVGYVEKIQNIQDKRGDYPETFLTAEEYDYYNPNNQTVKNKTSWTFLIYGPRGNDPDAIKQALIDYITRNSSRNVTQWRLIFPDIFKTTEFLLFPFWSNIAIREMISTQGIYSSFSRIRDDLVWMKTKAKSIDATHFDKFVGVLSRPYKSLLIGVIGSVNNRNNNMFLSNVYPDMISVSSTSLDFARMTKATQMFLEKLDDAIYRAEIHSIDMDLPGGYRRAKRDDVTFISFTMQNIRFMVATKDTTKSV